MPPSIPVGARDIASVLFGIISGFFFWSLGVGIACAAGLRIALWAARGSYQVVGSGPVPEIDSRDGVAWIDAVIDWLSLKLPDIFAHHREWNGRIVDTRRARSDIIGLFLRDGVYTLPLFISLSLILESYAPLIVSVVPFLCSPFIYWFTSRWRKNYRRNPKWLGIAEHFYGAVCWGIPPVVIKYF